MNHASQRWPRGDYRRGRPSWHSSRCGGLVRRSHDLLGQLEAWWAEWTAQSARQDVHTAVIQSQQ